MTNVISLEERRKQKSQEALEILSAKTVEEMSPEQLYMFNLAMVNFNLDNISEIVNVYKSALKESVAVNTISMDSIIGYNEALKLVSQKAVDLLDSYLEFCNLIYPALGEKE